MVRRLAFVLVAIAIVSTGFHFWWNQPERAVRRQISSLFRKIEIPADRGDLPRLNQGNQLEPLLAKNLEFDGPDERTTGSYSRQAAMESFSGVARFVRQITFDDLEIVDLQIHGHTATVECRVQSLVEAQGQRIVDGTQTIHLTFENQEKSWKLRKATWKEISRTN